MGLFDDMKAKIFGARQPEPQAISNTAANEAAKAIGLAAANRVAASVAGAPASRPATPAETLVAQAVPAAQPAAAPSPAAPPATAAPAVDVAAVLDAAVASSGQKLDWRKSIVDLMKALDIDSSLSARKELAKELGYSGDTGDSATMNIWLHKQVVQKLKDNGGKVPADLI